MARARIPKAGEFPNHLRALRLENGWSQLQIATALGMTEGAVSRHETDGRSLDAIMIEKYSSLYRVTPARLFIDPERAEDADVIELFPNRLKELRSGRGLTQTEAAKIMGIAQPTLHRHESGDRIPDGGHIAAYAILYKVSPSELFRRPE